MKIEKEGRGWQKHSKPKGESIRLVEANACHNFRPTNCKAIRDYEWSDDI